MYDNHPIVNNIQSWITLLQSRHKTIIFCWVPSHVNIQGDENEAKRAAVSNG